MGDRKNTKFICKKCDSGKCFQKYVRFFTKRVGFD
ncbi:hypothetical protein ITY58_000325 [Campylobacter lari]|nr:hypothetical protein [Campylobacter lari]EAL0271457.1 hypothetical protein [Campylobacter lari]EGO4876700.1 hypothetical protein [Campylobacter lari]